MRTAVSRRLARFGFVVCAFGLLVLAVPPGARSVPSAPSAASTGSDAGAAPAGSPRSRVSRSHRAVAAAERPPRRPDRRGAAACPGSSRRPILRAPGRGRTVALTFDDGPASATPAVLRILRTQHVHGTFFEIGQQVAAQPDLTRRVAAAGNLIENHSWSHRYPRQVPGGWSRAFLREDLQRTNAVLRETTGRQPCWFRPPGGFLMPALQPAARAAHLGVALWSVDTRDWANQNASRIGRAALGGLDQTHPIVLLHDGGGPRAATVAALPAVIDAYRRHGYRFVRLDGRS
jgi:peptidoglycan-N-acetylglucosamine deacetylase